uniref:VWFA domain-containing protein n=1 Tax=Periophthalmus magnuspinnatus TaxID=409849 RepID=A0A3B4ANT0_9GOBI
MVGLRNRSTWEPLLLKASCIKSCANGCSLGTIAHLTYANVDTDAVDIFVYPLGEKEVVVGFEAVIAGRLVGVHIESRGKLKDCCLDCCSEFGLEGHCGNSREWGCCGRGNFDMQCTNHVILDEDLERTTFIVGTGVIGPMDIVSITLSTTLELPTLENGAIRIIYPTVLTPIVTGHRASKSDNGGKSEEIATSCFGATSGKQDRAIHSEQQCAHGIFTSPAANLAPYELNFQLLVRGACLLALESPTHALRADADPSAQSASATYITLAQEHPYDRHIEIILHLPHNPLVIVERGRLSFSQYEQQISCRRDFNRCMRKDSDPEKKLEFVRKRYHKDIMSHPVLMLNFCPDLLSEPAELHKTTREVVFLIDRSGSMEAMVVALKSLPSGTTLNIVGFGTTVKPLFSMSRLCTDVTLMQANEYVQRMKADMRGTNLLGVLSWLYQQPMQRSCPRQIFIITDGTISSVSKILELVRRNTCSGCFGLGLGPRACRRLLQGVSRLTGGLTEYLDDEERLQPKLIKSLKKAFEPVLTDVRIDWYLPENIEALLSPYEIPPLYPGNCLIGYCTLYDTTNLKSKKTEDLEEALREIYREISSEFSCARDADPSLLDTGSLPQDLEKMPSPEKKSCLSRWADAMWHQNLSAKSSEVQATKEDSRRRHKVLARSTMAARSFSSPQGEIEMHRLRRALERVSFDQTLGGRLDESDADTKPPSGPDTLSHRSLNDSGLLFPASPLDWDSFVDPENLFCAVPLEDPPPGQCRSIIHGLFSGRPVSWEVTVDLRHLWSSEAPSTAVMDGAEQRLDEGQGEIWKEIVHQLTARSVIRDFEKMAEKESLKRYRTKAIQTSKHCNIVCMYTIFAITDSSQSKAECLDVQHTMYLGNRQNSLSGSRKQKTYSVGLGRRRTSRDSEDLEDAFNSTMESFFGTFPLGRLRSSISSGKQVPLKSHCLSAEPEKQLDPETPDYLPLVASAAGIRSFSS